MDFLKKLKLPVALKSEPAQPEAQPDPAPQKAKPEQGPPVLASAQASAQPRPQAAQQVRQHPAQPPLQQAAQPRGQTQAPPTVVTQATAPPMAQQQPQAPVWAQTGAQTGPQAQRQPLTRPQPPQPLKIAPRVVAAQAGGQSVSQATAQPAVRVQAPVRAAASQAATAAARPLAAPQPEARAPRQQPQVHPLEVRTAEVKTAEARPAETMTAEPQTAGASIMGIKAAPGVSGPTGHLGSTPGFWRTVWAMHPNRTKRRLRKLLLSWEKLGAYISSSGVGQELTPAAETAFLRAKIDIARSVGYLKLLDGVGGIAREADQKEAQFIELLERYPSLHSARSAGDVARRSLYYNWHQLYLFLHKMLGASPYEAQNNATAAVFGHRVETMVAPGRAVSSGGRRTG